MNTKLLAISVAAMALAGSAMAAAPGANPPPLSCSPAPCTFPNVQLSGVGSGYGPTMVSNPSNSLGLMAASQDFTCANYYEASYASADDGSTWSQSCLPLAAHESQLRYPVMIGYDANGIAYRGVVELTPTKDEFVIVVDHSADNGVTWSTPVHAVPAVFGSHNGGSFQGRASLSVDASASSPNKNAIYISASQYDSNGVSRITASHSTDGGATWNTVRVDGDQLSPSEDRFTNTTVGADGTVYLTWLRCQVSGTSCGGTTAHIMLSKSVDGGATWSKAARIAAVNLAPDACSCSNFGSLPNTSEPIGDVPVIAIDNSSSPTAGKLYLADYTWAGTYMKVQISSSTDGGNTWSKPQKLAPGSDKHDQFFPFVSVSGTGLVGVTWLDRRKDPSNISFDVYGAVSSDGGISYPNRKLSDVSSNPTNDGFGGDGFEGNDQNVAAMTGNSWVGNALYAIWTDTRSAFEGQAEVGGILAQ
jgi:hypothetical protein